MAHSSFLRSAHTASSSSSSTSASSTSPRVFFVSFPSLSPTTFSLTLILLLALSTSFPPPFVSASISSIRISDAPKESGNSRGFASTGPSLTEDVVITGEAFNFGAIVGSGMIDHANITLLDDDMSFVADTLTDEQGKFSFVNPGGVAVGDNITLLFERDSFTTTQTSTVTVPEGGLVGRNGEMTIQSPPDLMFIALQEILRDVGTLNASQCHFVVTVCGYNKTLYNLPQGEPGAYVTMDGEIYPETFYFGTFLFNHTDPFTRGLNVTSFDGGVLLFNVPLRPSRPYVIEAHKEGLEFSKSVLVCDVENRFVNGSPPWGPNVLTPPWGPNVLTPPQTVRAD